MLERPSNTFFRYYYYFNQSIFKKHFGLWENQAISIHFCAAIIEGKNLGNVLGDPEWQVCGIDEEVSAWLNPLWNLIQRIYPLPFACIRVFTFRTKMVAILDAAADNSRYAIGFVASEAEKKRRADAR
jgi:hypothetical protein